MEVNIFEALERRLAEYKSEITEFVAGVVLGIWKTTIGL